MNWRDAYRSKLCSHKQAAKVVKSGDRLLTPIGLGEPSTAAMDAVADRKDELKDIQYINALVFHPYKIFAPEYMKTFDMMCGFYNVLTMWQHEAGISSFIPIQSSTVGNVAKKRQAIDPRRMVIITQVSPPDDHGYVSLGLDLFFTPDIIDQGAVVIGEVNPNMPHTYGNSHYHVSRFKKFVEIDEPLFSPPLPEPSDVHKKIAANVVSLLRDRDCLQIGIGAVPGQISKLIANSDLKDLGIHTEMAPQGTHLLVGKGLVNCKYKTTHPNKIIDSMRSGPGGQLDFVIGAYWSEGGKAINIMPSTYDGGKKSRIVPYLTQGARVTVPRTYAQYIVTEWGIANLAPLNERERALALIEIAHPKFRADLLKAAKKRLRF
jgi:4-hydroxybutyrate CoA-transferase